MAGLSIAGFERKRLPEIIADIENELKTQFGEDIDLRSESVFGQIVGVLSLTISELWEEVENVYLAFDPDYATGTSIDSLAVLTGVTRIAASATTVEASIFGTLGTVIPAGSEARNGDTTDIYILQSQVTISASSVSKSLLVINTVSSNTAYTVTIDGTDYSITSDADATENEILIALSAALSAVPSFVEVNIDNQIVFQAPDLNVPFTLAVTENIDIDTIASPGRFNAAVLGSRFVPAGTLDEIQTPVDGWDSVLNHTDGTSGRDIETDAELRIRRRESVSFPATGTADSIRAKLLQLVDLQAAQVYENKGEVTDINGVPPQHIWVIAQGGDDTEIGTVIYQTKAGGIGTHGDTDINIISDSGQTYVISFERPTQAQLYIDMEISETEGYTVEAIDEIKTAIALWVAENITIGESLKYSRLFTPINSVAGFEVTQMFIGTAASPTGEVTLTAAIDEIILSSTTNINITVV